MAKTSQAKYKCFYCGKEYVESNYYKSYSDFFSHIGKIPYCKHCLGKLYQSYYEKYMNEGCLNAEQEAVKRVCMAFDIYYSAKAYNDGMNDAKRRNLNISPWGAYMKTIQLGQYHDKTYDTTLKEIANEEKEYIISSSNCDKEVSEIDEKIVDFFGNGFKNEDYKFLNKEYKDWVARHECKTKAQEEVFKRLCFKQLEILKATQRGEDTKDLDATFQKLLETAKLQPKQNSGDTTADNQTFGTLIDKWENTRPIPEIDEELKDVDKIALYINIFFKGHLAKMMGLKNGLSNLYTKFMKKYTVEKPEYNDEENSEILFDAIFGNPPSDSDEEKVVV